MFRKKFLRRKSALSRCGIKPKKSRHKSQESISDDFIPSPYVTHDPATFFSQCTPTELKIMNLLFKYSLRGPYIYPRQDTIANIVGCTRQYVNMVIRKLEGVDVIKSKYRHMTSCTYKVSKWFKNPWVRSQLRHIFMAFQSLCILLLFSLLTQRERQGGFILNKSNNQRFYKALKEAGALKKFRSGEISASHAYTLARYRDRALPPLEDIQKRGDMDKKPTPHTIDAEERKSRQIYGDNPIPLPIRDLEKLGIRLTRWGQMELVVFPDAAIEKAAEAFAHNTQDVRSPFNFIYDYALHWCGARKISPRYSYRDQLLQAYGAPEKRKYEFADDPVARKARQQADVKPKRSDIPGSVHREQKQAGLSTLPRRQPHTRKQYEKQSTGQSRWRENYNKTGQSRWREQYNKQEEPKRRQSYHEWKKKESHFTYNSAEERRIRHKDTLESLERLKKKGKDVEWLKTFADKFRKPFEDYDPDEGVLW